jgi:archaellum component FlaC
MPDNLNGKLIKLKNSRDNWRDRSNENQFKKRKLEDRIRYLEEKVEKQSEELNVLKSENEEIKKKQN